MMKKTTLYITFLCALATNGLASYTYVVYDYGDNKTLHNVESILVDIQGGMDGLTLWESSTATIQGTSALSAGSGGIWTIELIDNSSLYMSNGQVHDLDIGNDATAFLSGGLIQQIWSSQNAWINAGDPPVLVPNPHITIECLNHSYDTNTKLLTGHWLDNTAFSIHLIDVQGYSPAIENIQFIPEPATLSLLALGAFLAGRKRK